MKLGLEKFLDEGYEQFKGKRIGLITNMTGVNKDLVPTIDLFHAHPHIELTTLYAPEHGIRGDVKEGEKIDSFIDKHTGLPVISLYGENRKPSKEALENIDVLVFDLQDLGSRYYTYIYTMAYAMEACGTYNKQFVVLDRPNPINGLTVEGNLVEEDVRSFVGLLPIPNRHGMTVGELAELFKNEFDYECDLTVVPMEGWKRSMYFDDTGLFWIPPSPNASSVDMSILYTGTCLFEGTNLSEGRGTTKPFECVGAPYIDGYDLAKAFNERKLPGVIARPVSFIPTYQKHINEVCSGIHIHITDRDSVHSLTVGMIIVQLVIEMYPDAFEFRQNENGKYFFDLIAGTKSLKEDLRANNLAAFEKKCEEQVAYFLKQRKPYLIYD